jgi:hypothetical protein
MKRLINTNGVKHEAQSLSGGESHSSESRRSILGRRSFLKGLGATGAMLLPATSIGEESEE